VEKQFKPITLESFDPVTQESYRGSLAMIHTKMDNLNLIIENVETNSFSDSVRPVPSSRSREASD
jgi:hypothetical protein